jgi:hypothetical protein
MNPEKAVVLNVYSSLSSAESAATCLQARGIECLIQTDDCGGMLSPLDLYEGIKLVVDAENEQQAREMLSAMDTGASA